MMYISRFYGGPELAESKFDRVIAKVTSLRGAGKEGPFGSLDVVFHVPGSILDPEHSGIRTGRFSKKERMLMLQIAVPREILEQEEPEIQAFLLASLREAVRMATPVFQRAKIPYSEEEYFSLLDKIRVALMQ